MTSISRRERLLILAAVAVAVLVGIPGLLLPSGAAPTRSISSVRREHRDLQTQARETQDEIRSLNGEVVHRISPGTPRQLVQKIVLSAQSAAKGAGVGIRDLKPLAPEQTSGLQRVPVQISLSTRFPQAVRFLYDLQHQSGRFHVDQLEMVATDPQTDKLDMQLRLVGYVKSELEEDHAGS